MKKEVGVGLQAQTEVNGINIQHLYQVWVITPSRSQTVWIRLQGSEQRKDKIRQRMSKLPQ